MLTPDQVNQVLELLDRQLLFFASKTLGSHVLTDQEKSVLADHGIDYNRVYDQTKDVVQLNFYLGLLSSILSQTQAKNLEYNDLVKYIQSGQHIALSERERATIDSLKMQSMADIRSYRGKIFQDINNVVHNELGNIKSDQQEFIRETILQGTRERKSRREIARHIAKLSGDWSRNFDKSVQYISHTALNEGRAAVIERRYGDQAKVYFQVQGDACDQCIKHYLTSGSGSEPKIFTLKQLQQNGTNIGRKQSEWKPVLSALHPHCRCLATEYIPGTIWDGSRFVHSKDYKSTVDRPKIRIVFQGKEYLV